MKTPPFLLGTTLLFWGWQTGQTSLLFVAAVMALILEGARFIRVRWEFSDDEFARVWTFCNLLLLAAIILAFHINVGFSTVAQLFEDPNSTVEHNAGNLSQMTADVLFQWLPIIYFLFVGAQVFSSADGVPESVLFLLRNRRKRAMKRGLTLPPARRFDISYPYFALCLFSAAGHAAQDNYFYFGFCALLGWALWPQRSRRLALPLWLELPLWVGSIAVAATLGYFGQRAFGQLSHLAEEYDPQIISLFWHQLDPQKTFTSIGDVGRMKLSGKIVIRLQTQDGAPPPIYLREASYRNLQELQESSYPGLKHKRIALGWNAGNTNYVEVLEIPPDSGTFPLHSGPANRSVANIACYLSGISEDENHYPKGLLPLPADCNRLESSHAYSVSQSGLGTVQAEGPRLMIFDARYGSGMIMDDPPEVNESQTNEDLAVPTNEVAVLQKVISNLDVSDKSDEQKIFTVSQYFKTNFTYSLWQDAPAESETNSALTRFLQTTHRGHCEYFATATVLLLRELGIPARYAVGYYVHEPSRHGYVVRLRDGHAWCLAWDKKNHCWRNFDTTPGSWVADEEDHISSFQFLSDFQSWLEFETLKFFDYSHNNIRDYVFWALIPALAFLLYRIFRGGRRLLDGDSSDRPAWPGFDSEFYELEQKLIQGGLPREPGEPLSAWLRRVTNDSRLANLRQPLENILVLHYRYRFDPRGLKASERQELRREVETCLTAVAEREL